MALKTLTNIFCGLNLGLIYNLSYSYSPQDGVKISILFAKEDGVYPNLQILPLTKTSIQIGTAFFSMYPISYNIEKSGSGRRVMQVDFIDETFRLDNYLVVLTGRGCGEGVYQLGSSVDRRTTQQKVKDALDPDAQTIKNFTQFDDVEYSFDTFLNVLRTQFNVQINATYEISFTKQYTGTFRDVLNNWCNFYNLSYFFENNVLNIFDPTKITINLPKQLDVIDALEYNYSESAESTYSKTAFIYFQKDGDQFNLNKSSSNSNVISTATLYPVGGELNLKTLQTNLDLNQVVAAQYGKEFWFLYNYFKGTAAIECGWTIISTLDIENVNLRTSITSLLKAGILGSSQIAKINNKIFDQKYEAYFNYGQKIAGKYYISDTRFNLLKDSLTQWFNVTDATIVNFASDFAKQYQVTLEYLSANNSTIGESNAIPETVINSYFDGVKYLGDRMVFIDSKFNPSENLPPLDTNLLSSVDLFYKQVFIGVDGSNSIDTSSLGGESYVVFFGTNFDQPILDVFNSITDLTKLFQARYKIVDLDGLDKQDLSKFIDSEKQGDNIKIVQNSDISVTGNTGIIRAINNGSSVVYYDKFSKCASFSSPSIGTFKRRFNQQNISYDIPVVFSYQNKANNTYKIDRDLTNINKIINSNLLQTIAQPRTFTTQKVTMSFNYFYAVPANFLTNGLVSFNLEIGDNGITASYVFSNEVLQVPFSDSGGNVSESFIEKLESVIKNSWIRTYSPTQVITQK